MPVSADSNAHGFLDGPDDARIMAYVLHRDSPRERAAFEEQLRDSDLLKARVYELTSLVQWLRSIPEEEPPADLPARTMQAVGRTPSGTGTDHLTPPVRVHRLLLPIAAAAALLLVSAIVAVNLSEPDRRRRTARSAEFLPIRDALSQGLRWLASAQQPSGMWDAGRWGGDRRHNAGLTGLALMALLTAEGHEAEDYSDHIRRAAGFLLSIQKENGFLGTDQGSCAIDHCMATCALLEAYHRYPTRHLAAAIEQALPWVSSLAGFSSSAYQVPDRRGGDPLGLWIQLVMRLAQREGFATPSEGPAPSSRGEQVLRRRVRPSARGRPSVQILIRLAEARHPDASAPDSSPPCATRAVIRILQRQDRSGTLAGSWDDLDGYGRIGGRVYSTALAVLALQGYLAG